MVKDKNILFLVQGKPLAIYYPVQYIHNVYIRGAMKNSQFLYFY